MSTTPIADLATETQQTPSPRAEGVRPGATLLVCLPFISSEDFASFHPWLSSALDGYTVRIAAPGVENGELAELLSYPVDPHGKDVFSLTAADFSAAAELSAQCDATATLVLGIEASTLSTESLRRLADAVLGGDADLALPRYRSGPHEALVSSALLYPLTRALFSVEAHLPLPLDAAFSARMAARLRIAAKKPAPNAEDHPLLWPVAEAAVASLIVREVEADERTLPHPAEGDLNSLLASVAGSLFADIEAKATFWQRARPPVSAKAMTPRLPNINQLEDSAELHAMAEEFRNAFDNLQEIWSLVLPPQSLLALKKLSRVAPEAFELPANLWARVVYDFVLAWHLRTINRGHLLGSFTPLYLAWVASHLRISANDANDAAVAQHHAEEAASAFVAEKAYLVSRWRWPDRFNP